IPFLDLVVVAEQDGSYFVLFQVERNTGNLIGQIQQLARHHALQSVDFSDAVANLHDSSHLGNLNAGVVPLQLLAYYLTYLVCLYSFHSATPPVLRVQALACSFLKSISTRGFRDRDHLLFDCFQLCAYRPVVDDGAYSSNCAPYQRRIHLEVRLYPLTRHRLEPADYHLAFGGADCFGRRDFGRNHTPAPVYFPLELLVYDQYRLEPVVLEQQAQQVRCRLRRARSGDYCIQHLELVRLRDSRVWKKSAQLKARGV